MDQLKRLESIRRKLSQGLLPRDLPDRIWGGPANGSNTCAACGELIRPGTLEIEAICVDGRHRLYHSGCHSMLSLEREAGSDGGFAAAL